MPNNKILLELGPKGELKFPAQIVEKYRLKQGMKVYLDILTSSIALLEREEALSLPLKNSNFSISFIGKISSFGVADIFSVINMGQKTGVLIFEYHDLKKNIYFRNGEIIYAQSTDPEDRLGNILFKVGKISKEQLREAEREMVAGKRFGTILLEKGYITEKDLWAGIKYQIEEIVYSVFTLQEGVYYFIEGELVYRDLGRFSLNTQNILMEGFRRLDEMNLIREKIPSQNVVFRKLKDQPKAPLPPSLQKLWSLIDGKRTLAELIRLSGLGEFNAYKAVYELLRSGLIEVVEDVEEEQDLLSRVAREYNELVKMIMAEIKKNQPRADVVKLFNTFLQRAPEKLRPLYKGVSFHPSGRLDIGAYIRNIKNSISQDNFLAQISGMEDLLLKQKLTEGLNELINFGLILAKKYLPKEKADEIIVKVRQLQKKIQKKLE